jgi:hypothetical protein
MQDKGIAMLIVISVFMLFSLLNKDHKFKCNNDNRIETAYFSVKNVHSNTPSD